MFAGRNNICHSCSWKQFRVMKSRYRRVWGDAVMSAGVFAIVLIVLVSVDDRVREHVQTRMTETATLGGAAAQLGETGSVLWDAVRTQSVEHAPMMTFVVIAAVLLLCMLRT